MEFQADRCGHGRAYPAGRVYSTGSVSPAWVRRLKQRHAATVAVTMRQAGGVKVIRNEGGAMDEGAGVGRSHLRVARPTDNLAAVVAFYRDGLGLEVLAEFADHDGFDGVMLGCKGDSYHLEFTRAAGHAAGRAPSPDHLLVFYLPDEVVWRAAIARLEQAGHRPVAAFNPYWDWRGRTFEDPDGYRVVLQCASWPTEPAAAPDPARG